MLKKYLAITIALALVIGWQEYRDQGSLLLNDGIGPLIFIYLAISAAVTAAGFGLYLGVKRITNRNKRS